MECLILTIRMKTMKTTYPKLDPTFLRSAGIFGAPPLNDAIQTKLIEAFINECEKREIDITSGEFLLECSNLIIDYAVLYGGDINEVH